MDDLLTLIARLADENPLTRSTEGLDDGCFFCGADTDDTGRPNYYPYAVHDHDCPWVEARHLLGHDLGLHKVKATIIEQIRERTQAARELAGPVAITRSELAELDQATNTGRERLFGGDGPFTFMGWPVTVTG